ncbi:MAG: hypothetical protein EBZ61_07380 [Micrococcales bacterium]|nr:hypothetical protein [Micrococcales bacterium]
MTTISEYYQLPDNVAPAGDELIDAELIDFLTGDSLIDPADQKKLTGDAKGTLVLVADEGLTPVVITNSTGSQISVDIINRNQSEVATTLLGVERSETALGLFDAVNIYGVNDKEFYAGPDSAAYVYATDPTDWTFADDYGYFWRHIPAESALQAYAFPPPISFTYLVDDNSGRFPGGKTDGSMRTFWESKRTFRYQPGRVNSFTFGVRMSTGSDYQGEVVRWGCRNSVGDGYFFQFEKGSDLYIVRTSPDLGTLKVDRDSWNGDPIQPNEGSTGWNLDLSRVTMFKIEFSWYGAVGAKFLAYVPIDHDEARWVALHYIFAENQFTVPSLRSPFLKLFVEAQTTAGATSPAFINLYGSSVYIDGGDKGTVTTGAAGLDSLKPITNIPRSLIGLQVKSTINGVANKKAVFPNGLSAFATTDARLDLVFQENGTCGQESYFYGNGTTLTSNAASGITVTRAGANVLITPSGQFFPDIRNEISGSTDYRLGRKTKVVGAGILATHVVSITDDLTTITTDRTLPGGITSITFGRMNNYAVSSGFVASGVMAGTIFRQFNSGYSRVGLLPNASGLSYNPENDTVLWVASDYPVFQFNRFGQVVGEARFPSSFGCNQTTDFSIAFPNASTTTISAAGRSITISGNNPWPIRLVVEGHSDSVVSDVVLAEQALATRLIPGSGSTQAQTSWPLTSGMTQNSAAAGGTEYVANKFENTLADPLSAVLVDTQGQRVLRGGQRVATYFIASGESRQFDLSPLFGPDKMFITGQPGSIESTGALFVVATARTASGEASVSINWEEQ